jgi:hypothetical protein
MNILNYIEKLIEKWDGSDEQASLIISQINLALLTTKVSLYQPNEDE